LKKRTKKLLLLALSVCARELAAVVPEGAKGFWFFFSKKNCFPVFLHPLDNPRQVAQMLCVYAPGDGHGAARHG
jgi:hypothetical protein